MTKNTFRWECHYHKNTGILNIKYSNLAAISEYKKNPSRSHSVVNNSNNLNQTVALITVIPRFYPL